jgi:hypothetical protein
MSGDTVWVYNITDKVYSELRVYGHSYTDNLTYIKRTGREQNYLPLSAKFVPSAKLARIQYGADDVYYMLQRNTWYDKLRDFKNSVISRILWKIKGDTGIV